MDEEGADMMTYQSHYNAAARYMTVLDEALETIINGMGTVGR
jgi:flagellar hook-associated protein 1 FlgK